MTTMLRANWCRSQGVWDGLAARTTNMTTKRTHGNASAETAAHIPGMESVQQVRASGMQRRTRVGMTTRSEPTAPSRAAQLGRAGRSRRAKHGVRRRRIWNGIRRRANELLDTALSNADTAIGDAIRVAIILLVLAPVLSQYGVTLPL